MRFAGVRSTFPAEKMVPWRELKLLTRGARQVVKKDHIRRSRRWLKSQLRTVEC